MLRMVSYSDRPKSGQITCYLNRTYHVLTTITNFWLDSLPGKDYGLLRHRRETIDCLMPLRVIVTKSDRHYTEVAYLASGRSTGVETSGPVRVSRLAIISPLMEC